MSGNTKSAVEVEATRESEVLPKEQRSCRCGGKWYDSMFILSEIIVIILYAFFTEFETGDGLHPGASQMQQKEIVKGVDRQKFGEDHKVQIYYPIFQDVHIMTFVGFGFIKVFLKKHSWTSIGYSFMIGAWAFQISILAVGFWRAILLDDGLNSIKLDMSALIVGDFGAASVLICYGALLGKCTLPQLWIVATLQVFFYALNEAVIGGLMEVVDIGGCVTVHMFGAYFGVAASYFFEPRAAKRDRERLQKNEGGLGQSGYNNQTIAMIGTLFLFCYWPSYNSAMALQYQQHQAIFNTIMSITGSTISACAVSRMWTGKLNMEVVLNATLAGGIIIGSCCCLIVNPVLAIIIGVIGGIVSSLGYLKLNSFLQEYAYLYDTCGVQFLHGIPGLLGGIAGAFVASQVEFQMRDNQSKVVYHDKIANIFHAMSKTNGNRSENSQGFMQLAAIGVSMAIALLSGALTGLLTSKVGEVLTVFHDEEHWDDDNQVLCASDDSSEENEETESSKQVESSDSAPMETESRFNVGQEDHRERDNFGRTMDVNRGRDHDNNFE